MFAMITKAHMKEFGTTSDTLASISAKSHSYAKLNPIAQYPFEVTKEQVLASPELSDPIRTLESCTNPDGAAALILTNQELAEEYTKKPVFLIWI